jgi:DNA-binding HxlR family transcriptional regulator
MAVNTQMCPKFHAAMELLAKRWTGLLVYALGEKPLRFGELSSALEGVGDRMLTERLKELEEQGIVSRTVMTRPLGVEYALTKKGKALRPVFDAIGHWADEWIELPRKARAK